MGALEFITGHVIYNPAYTKNHANNNHLYPKFDHMALDFCLFSLYLLVEFPFSFL